MVPYHARILIVDDMPSIREMVRKHLKGLGYQNIFESEDGSDAFYQIVNQYEKKEPIDLVVSDWNMPKMKGIELLKAVRGHAKVKDVPFVLLTSESERQQVTEAVLAGVSQYIIKPFSGKTFEEKINSAWLKHHKT